MPAATTSCVIPMGAGPRYPVHQGRDVAKGTLRGILSDTGLTVEDLQRLL